MFSFHQQSHRRWCNDTNQRCSISTMLQTTMMLWFWSTMSHTMMMFQYWSMMLQTMIMIGLHNLAKRMKTRFKDINTWSKKWLWNQRCWKWKKRMINCKEKKWAQLQLLRTTSAVSPQTLLSDKGLNTCNALLCKTEYSVNDWNWHTMPPVQGNRPLSRVTGPCLGLQAPHVAPSRLYLVLSILICWHVKVGDQETCGDQSSYGWRP